MKCKYCGCTEGKPCFGGCAWAKPNVCTNCVLVPHNIKQAVEAYLTDPNVESLELVITEYPQNTHKKKIEQRFLILK